MSLRSLRRRLAAAIAAAGVIAAAGCANSAEPSPAADVAGSWNGTAILPNAYTAVMALQQNGTAVTGTLKIAGVMGQTPVSGDLEPPDAAFTWRVSYECEVWTGTLTLDGAGGMMSGPLSIDRSGCVPSQPNGTGKLNLTRQ